MKITWKDVKDTLLDLGNFVKEKGYMYTIASKEGLITEEWIEQLVQIDDLMTCAGGFAVSHMKLREYVGTVKAIQGLPVETIFSLGSVCASLQTHGPIAHCVVHVDVLLNTSGDFHPGALNFLSQISIKDNVSICLVAGQSQGSEEERCKSVNWKRVLDMFNNDNVVFNEGSWRSMYFQAFSKYTDKHEHYNRIVVFAPDVVTWLMSSGVHLVVVKGRNGAEEDERLNAADCLRIDSFDMFDFNQFI